MGKSGKQENDRESEIIVMADQRNNQLKKQDRNSYQKETSQIHAPADLILKTKQAVAQEEKRLEQNPRPKIAPYLSISKWIVPMTAVAALVLIFHISKVQFSRSSADSAGGINEEASAEYEAAPAEEEMPKAADETAQDGEGSTAGGIAESESVEDFAEDRLSAASDKTSGSMAEEENDDRESAPADASADAIESSEIEQKKLAEGERAVSGQGVTIEEVKSIPMFYRASETERVESHGIFFYIAEKDSADAEAAGIDGWRAYAEYSGKKYVIAGSAVDQEEFLAKAYELLVETD